MDVETYNKAKYRGKLYALSEDQAWEDTGTGYVSVVTGPGPGTETDGRRLIFREEEKGDVLHDRPLYGKDIYQLQGDPERQTIIVWEDPETQKDWALSFQDAEGTTEVWEAISTALPDVAVEVKSFLPLPTLANVGDVSRMLSCVPPSQRETLAGECIAAAFLTGLRECFHTAEDLRSDEALAQLWQCAKGIFLLSNQKLTERYLRNDVCEDIMGMLEYDDGLPPEKRIPHRQVLKVNVNFRHVVDFEDEDGQETLERIHLNYRLQYLKDCVLPRLLDDAAFVSLTQMIHSNLSVILDHLQKHTQLLDQLFLKIRQKEHQSLLFLQDLCRVAKLIPPLERQALYEKMVERNIFEVLAPLFCDVPLDGEPQALNPRHLAVEILLISTLHDSSALRRFLGGEGNVEGRGLLSALIRRMHVEEDQGVQSQIGEMLRNVLDPTTLEQRERDSFLDVFYEHGAFDELSAPLRSPAETPSACFGQQLVCELLAFAVTHHGYRAKIYVVRHGLAQQAARLMAAPQRFLQLAPVRLVRAMVGTKDDAYHRLVVKCGLFGPMLRNLRQSLLPPALGGNLLVSATLELLEFIRVENFKMLVDHICKKHVAVVQEHAPKFKTLEGLMLKHHQNLEYEAFPPDQHASGGPITRANSGGGSSRPSRLRSPGRGNSDSDDDEAYFESLDDDDEDTDDDAGAGAGNAQPAAAHGASEGPVQGQEDVAVSVAGEPSLTHPGGAHAPAPPGTPPLGDTLHVDVALDLEPGTDSADGAAVAAGSPTGATDGGSSTLQGLLGGYVDEEEDENPSVRGSGPNGGSMPGAGDATGGHTHGDAVATDADGGAETGDAVVAEDVGGAGAGSDINGNTTIEPNVDVKLSIEEVQENGKVAAPEKLEAVVAESPANVTAKAKACAKGGPGGSTNVNHVSKRLKTSQAEGNIAARGLATA